LFEKYGLSVLFGNYRHLLGLTSSKKLSLYRPMAFIGPDIPARLLARFKPYARKLKPSSSVAFSVHVAA
jgi:hypothetical protein